MVAITHDQGIVLRSYSFGEADKVVILISPNRGKLRTVAKGIRKTKSRFGGRLEPFSHVDLVLYEGRNLDTITQVSVIEAFPRLRADYDAVILANAMTEVVDAVVQEDEAAFGLFLTLQRGLMALEAGNRSRDVLVTVFLRVADILGVAPSLDRCAGCGRAESGPEHFRFGFAAGGLICEACAPAGAYRLRQGVIERLAELASSDLRTLSSEESDLSADALGVARRYLEHHLERRLSSMAVMYE